MGQSDPDRFSHAVLSIPRGKYSELSKDLRKFLETELDSYKPIEKVEVDNLPQAKLEYIERESGKVGETSFPNYFPVDMLKGMLKENGMLLSKKKVASTENDL